MNPLPVYPTSQLLLAVLNFVLPLCVFVGGVTVTSIYIGRYPRPALFTLTASLLIGLVGIAQPLLFWILPRYSLGAAPITLQIAVLSNLIFGVVRLGAYALFLVAAFIDRSRPQLSTTDGSPTPPAPRVL